MKTIYMVTGGHGTPYFSSREEAERYAKGIPSDWGSALPGGRNQSIREVKLFDTAEEWKRYTGANSWNLP